MNRQFKYVFLLLVILVLSLAACDDLPATIANPASSQEVKLLTDAQIEVRPQIQDQDSAAEGTTNLAELEGVNQGAPALTEKYSYSPNDSLNLKDPDSGEIIESIQADKSQEVAPVFEDSTQVVDAEEIPSLEERETILDWVNLGGLVFPESEQAPVGEGPEPGTEMIPASGVQKDDILDRMNQVDSMFTEQVQIGQSSSDPEFVDADKPKNPEDILSLEERDAILDWVNRGGLVFPESEQALVVEGLKPGTETVIGAENSANIAEDMDLQLVVKFVEMLRNWWQDNFGP